MKFENFEQLEKIFEVQKLNRWEFAQTSAIERIQKLKKLRCALIERKEEFYEAIWKDFHKSKFEAWATEIFPTIEEIDCAISNLKKWMKGKRGSWVFFLPTTCSRTKFEPKGQVLVMAPWNYPLHLFISPIASAIAAGNVVMAKPSHKTPNVSSFLTSLFENIFRTDEVSVIEGEGAIVGEELLKLPFDHIFFTGSPKVGAHIGEISQRYHAGITLELGGKSPTVILEDVNIKQAANRITWGKMLNAGQTCIAPDYILCPKEKVDELAEAIAEEIKQSFGETEDARKASDDFPRIVEKKATEHHQKMINDAVAKGAKVVIGGKCDIENRYTPPTVLKGVTAQMEIMDSEIFGPILPIVSYENLDEAIEYIQKHPKPLSLYIFGKSRQLVKKVLNQTTAGSTCVNNTIIQIENITMPFGGVGNSGIGSYHGFYGFKAFSHERNVMHQHSFDIIKYFHPPYRQNKVQDFLKKFLDIFKKM